MLIPGIGHGNAEKIAEQFDSYGDFIREMIAAKGDASLIAASLNNVYSSDSSIVASLAAHFTNAYHCQEALELAKEMSPSRKALKGDFVVTGKMPKGLRQRLKMHYEQMGYSERSEVTKETTILITGEEPTKRKVDKALLLGIPVIHFKDVEGI